MNPQTVIEVDFPSDVLQTLNEDIKELKKDIKISLAIRLYLQEKLTVGKAAQLADLSRLEFENLLSESHIPISSLNLEEILSDIQKLK